MTAPGNQDGKLPEDKTDNQDELPAKNEPVQDLIPVPLLVGIFALLMVVTWFLLADNWVTEMTRYRSTRALKTQNWEAAVVNLEKLIEAGAQANDNYTSHSPTLLSEMGMAHMHQENYPEALHWLGLAQEHRTNFRPDDQGNPRPPADFNHRIGYVQYLMGDLEAAKDSMEKALEFDKLNPQAHFVLGEIAMKQGRYVEAADNFKVVASNPQYADQVKAYYAEIEEKLFADIN